MRKIVLLMFVMMLVVTGMAHATKAGVLAELNRPEVIAVDGDKIFVAEGPTVAIYNAKDLRLVKRFGKQGEGPEEFKGKVTWIEVKPDYIAVHSMRRISRFKKDGQFIDQADLKFDAFAFRTLGDNYVAVKFLREDKVINFSINLYGKDQNQVKHVYKTKNPFQDGKTFDPITISSIPQFHATAKYVLFEERKTLISIFDAAGKKLGVIDYAFEKVPFTKTNKQGYINFFKNDPTYKDFYASSSAKFAFPDVFPAIRDFRVSRDSVYVLTYKEEGANKEFFVFDMAGKLQKTIKLPLVDESVIRLYPYTIADGKLYQLVENEEEEEWELHILDIK